jgi:hypothetical protein
MEHRIEDRIDPGTVERLKALRDGTEAPPASPSMPEPGDEA